MMDSKKIAMIGAGLMGHGIALIMARAGHHVTLSDPDADMRASLHERVQASMEGLGATPDQVQDSLSRITTHDSLGEALEGVEFVFEAAPEKVELKRAIFQEIESHVSESCVLASNTSVIQISSIMSVLKHRERAVGTHWWNPPHQIPLVEVVKTEWSDPDVAMSMMNLLEDAGKTPVLVEKDVPGFIGNRLQHALWREAVSLVERGICDAKSVDTVIKASFGRRLAVLGPLENADLVGTDLSLDIHENVLFDLEDRNGPSPYLEKLVAEGKLGMKSGEGFQKWTPEEADEVRARVTNHLQRLEKILD